jgi:hypothetical protein
MEDKPWIGICFEPLEFATFKFELKFEFKTFGGRPAAGGTMERQGFVATDMAVDTGSTAGGFAGHRRYADGGGVG